jgi:hypothetical protein
LAFTATEVARKWTVDADSTLRQISVTSSTSAGGFLVGRDATESIPPAAEIVSYELIWAGATPVGAFVNAVSPQLNIQLSKDQAIFLTLVATGAPAGGWIQLYLDDPIIPS